MNAMHNVWLVQDLLNLYRAALGQVNFGDRNSSHNESDDVMKLRLMVRRCVWQAIIDREWTQIFDKPCVPVSLRWSLTPS